MGIRRSLRLQSRTETSVGNKKKTVKKIKLPRKRKAKVKKSTKSMTKTLRRSTRIRKRNSLYANEGEKSGKEMQKVDVIDNLKIEPCEVKLEQIDVLIEKMNIAIQEPKSSEAEGNDTNLGNEPSLDKNTEIQPSEPTAQNDSNCFTEETDMSNAEIQGNEEQAQKEPPGEKEEIAKQIMEMLNQYKIHNEIDFDEIDSISNSTLEENTSEYLWEREKPLDYYSEKIINNVFFNNTNAYNFKSSFKDRASLTAAFDRHSGQISNETYPYDINETPEAEKVKRFYRKSISDPSLHSWYQYNVASSRRISKQESEPYMDKYLIF